MKARLIHWLADEAEVVRVEGMLKKARWAKYTELLAGYGADRIAALDAGEQEALFDKFNKWESDADMALDANGWTPGSREYIEFDSAWHPEHEFKVGYWHTGALAAVLTRTTGDDLNDLMRPWLDDDMVEPNWLDLAVDIAGLRERFVMWAADRMSILTPRPFDSQLFKRDALYTRCIQALDVMVETCEWVAKQPGRYVMEWRF